MKQKLKEYAALLIAAAFTVLVAAAAIYIDYKIWRAMHPDAPTWTYIFSN